MYIPKGKSHTHKGKVYFGDTDAAGVVYYGNYLRFLEMGRIEYLQAMGYPYKSLRAEGIGLVPVHLDMNYHSPLKFEDNFTVSAAITRLSKASLIMTQSISCESVLICSATIKLACCDEVKFKAIKLPESLINTLIEFEKS
ncbi:MAG: 4-hydroxybenzoyl-CoA thioesterase [Rickettsiales bacterium]|nr:4-hydroxybenzoyl-CoA thioesterase [Rickettsiales bacterium]